MVMGHFFFKMIRRYIFVLVVLFLLLTFTGCAGGSKPFTISGKVVNGNGDGIDGVSIVVTGGKSVKATTGIDGKYVLTSLTGTCTLTPILEGYTFDPKNIEVTGESANKNFTGTRVEPKVSTLTVVNGAGSGDYAEGAIVAISANAPESGKVFGTWTANNGGSFASLYAETTDFIMPGNDVTVTATYRNPTSADYFEFDSNTGTITGFFKKGKHNNLDENLDPEIPSAINGVSVKIIGEEAFKDAQITSVVIPEGVTTIEKRAFNNNLLTSVIIPDTVVTIGELAFTANYLANIVIPDGVKVIARSVFWLNQLTSVTLPNSVEHIGMCAFEDNLLEEVTIPNSVISIGESAFLNNKLTTVVIPNGVSSIGNGAFADNNELSSLQIPDNVSIDRSAFYQGYRYVISSITIGTNVTLGLYLLGENDNFKNVYDVEGAGIYKKVGDNWVKQ